LGILQILTASSTLAQISTESLTVYTEHPRLLLPQNRLKRLQRERERQSARWVQLAAFINGKAPMQEKGFAQGLYYKVSEDREAGRRAIEWALGPGADLRQLALIFDWCQELLTASESKTLTTKLLNGIQRAKKEPGVGPARSRMFAAIALAGHAQQASEAELENLVRSWWEKQIVATMKSGRDVLPREELYPLMEFLHAARDNLNMDLRDSLPKFFKDLPMYHLIAHYPATYPAADGEYRIPASFRSGDPDIRTAALSRAAALSLVAFDVNAPESQFLQGWIQHDNFILRGTFGAPYEFLWANPYLPGLSYYHMPLTIHDPAFGRLFIRSDWEDTAAWLGYEDGVVQLFRDGRLTTIKPDGASEPIDVTQAVVFFGKGAERFTVQLHENQKLFLLGLEPSAKYEIEVDDEEVREGQTDAGGILQPVIAHEASIGVRLRRVPAPAVRTTGQ
jgi:hypothetical protein